MQILLWIYSDQPLYCWTSVEILISQSSHPELSYIIGTRYNYTRRILLIDSLYEWKFKEIIFLT